MSEPLRSVHVRLSSEVHERVKLMAAVSNEDIAEVVEKLVTESVMGRFHALKVTAERMQQLGIVGNARE